MLYNDIKNIVPRFHFEGKYERCDEISSGNINSTYHLVYRMPDGTPREYLLQRINSYAFKDPRAVMRNIQLVSDHIKATYDAQGIDCTRRMLRVIDTTDGSALYDGHEDGFWRAYNYIDHATAYDQVTKPEHFYEAGRAFGEFQRLLTDFPANLLVETIPDFHNTLKRFYAFVASVAADKAGRVRDIEPEIEFFFDRRRMMSAIVRELDAGNLPVRVTHNDTKINNVMIDDITDKAICVIDLDTVMPGSALYDYGDAIRSGASTAAEDEEDLSKVALDMDMFELFTRGFLSEVHGILTPLEKKMLPLSIKIIACELAMRFLTDYIDGDLYFKVRSPEHNLIRARNQMKLLTDIESKFDTLQARCDAIAAEMDQKG